MNQPISPKTHPFPMLLALEWVMLGLSAATELLPGLPSVSTYPWLSVPLIALYGLMGLRLPTQRIRDKMIYTLLEIGLINVITGVGSTRLVIFLYVPLVIRSGLIFNVWGQMIVSAIVFILFMITFLHRIQLILPQLELSVTSFNLITFSMISIFGLTLIFLVWLIQTLLTERRSQDQLAQANQQLRHYALRIETLATVQERNRIAREIHDSLGHSLTALNIQLEGSLKLWQINPPKSHAFLTEAKRLGSTALQEVRHSVGALRSDPLQGKSLGEGIRQLAKEFAASTGVTPTCELELNQRVSPEVSTAVYRILQEGLNNICKYAAATEVEIKVQTDPGRLRMMLTDDGKGFDPKQNTTGFGLQGMQERTQVLQGQFQLTAQPGAGCRLQIQIPLEDY